MSFITNIGIMGAVRPPVVLNGIQFTLDYQSYFYLPAIPTSYGTETVVYWGDGQSETINNWYIGHSYSYSDYWVITIVGYYPAFSDEYNAYNGIKSIQSFGDPSVTQMSYIKIRNNFNLQTLPDPSVDRGLDSIASFDLAFQDMYGLLHIPEYWNYYNSISHYNAFSNCYSAYNYGDASMEGWAI